EHHVPVIAMQIPGVTLEKTIEKARSITIFNQSSSVQIVAGYVRIKHMPDVISEKGKRHVEGLMLRLEEYIKEYGRKTQAMVLATKDHTFMLLGTKRILDHITNNYRNFPLLSDIEEAVH